MYVPPSDISNVTALVPKSSNLYLLPPSDTTFTAYVFEGAVPAPIQFHDAKFALLPLKSELLPSEKPSELKEVRPALSVASAPVVLDIKYLVAPLTISLILLEFAFVLSFNQTQSG